MTNISVKKILILILVALNVIGFAACTTKVNDPFIDFTYEKEEEKIDTEVVVREDFIVNEVIFAKSVPLNKFTHYYTEVTGYLKEYTVNMGDIVSVGDVIAILDSSTLDKQMRDQTIKYKKAKLRFEKAKLEYETSGLNENSMLSAELDFEYEELKYNNLLEQYVALELKAEISGKVTKRQAHTGDFINAKNPIIDITDSSEILISFDSKETSGLRLGDVLDLDIRNVEENVPATIIEINGSETILRPDYIHESFNKLGALVYVNILQDMRIGALLIDVDCVVSEAGRHYVYVIEDGVKSERDIKVGITNSGMTEVLFGLEEGEVVISRPH